MLTVATAALKACVSESLIRLWVKEGTLACYRLGGKNKRGTIRIQEEDLDQVMAAFKAVPSAPPVRQKVSTVRPPLKHLDLT